MAIYDNQGSEQNNNLIAEDGTPFRFGVDENGNYGYVVTDSEGADTVIPFKGLKAIYNTGKNGDKVIPSWQSVIGKTYLIAYTTRTSSVSGIKGGTIKNKNKVTDWGSSNVYFYLIEAIATDTTMSLSQTECYGIVYEC